MQNQNSYIYYVGFYSKADNPNKFRIFPATNTKMDYIVSAVKEAGFKISIFALGEAQTTKWSFFKRKLIKIDEHEKITYVSTFGAFVSINKFLSRLWLLLQLFFFLSFEVKKSSTVIYYHSFATLGVVRLSKFFNNYRLVYEVEEIFQAAWQGTDKKIKNEINSLKNADAYIFVNDLFASKCGFTEKPSVVCYGDYRIINTNKPIYKSNEVINIVYAGVIGTSDSDVYLAINTMNFLPNNYVLHLLGYGTAVDIVEMELTIKGMNDFFGFVKILFHGRLSGNEYTNFLRNCQIGLSTRVLQNKYSDYTFPSKVLVYLCNNLVTVSSPISCITQSKIASNIFFYELSTPESVCKKILSLKSSDYAKTNNDSIRRLNDNFIKDLKIILNADSR
ncbi:hypothetical protein [Flavobacterium sp. GP15]|uniref:hypothetical protein n=1 Tax=Flavobacterium sp. GP15 TaxID=2758567 RepID=UPI00165E8279|nr:hypothetical protein [Flavobacterium sp. GP15]